MHYATVILLILLMNMPRGFAQHVKTELHRFIGAELIDGEYTFQLMKNKLVDRNIKGNLRTDENGKILIVERVNDQNVPEVKFLKSGSIKFNVKYVDSILIIRPIENSFAPLIKIDITSSGVYLNDRYLSIIKEINVPDNENGFNSPWKGFQWRTFSKDTTATIKPRLTLGKLKENGKLYLEIIWFENGKPIHYRLLN